MARPLTKAIFLILVLALLPSRATAFFVSQDYGSVLTMSLGPKSAHEEITRQSKLDVQALLAAQGITSLSRFESQENLASNPKLRGYSSGDAEFFIIFPVLDSIVVITAHFIKKGEHRCITVHCE